MKLVSPKTLVASLLCAVLVVIKIGSIDEISDLFWVVLLGYLIVKGLYVSFSQKAYDEDMKQARQGKALYRDLFGKFAFIAADIPIITIILSGLLAAYCPVTPILRGGLIVLLLFAVSYALWFSWYISKQKQLRKESGEWDAATLSAEEEKAWKRFDVWHTVGLGMIAVLGALYLLFGDPMIYMNNAKLEDAILGIDGDSVTLEELVPFEWTTVYTFDPYTSLERIERITGSKSPALKESVSEGMTHFVFTDHGRVVASVCAYPSSLGYSLAFAGGKYTYYDYADGGYSHIEYGDEIEFEVTQEEGIVRLYTFVDE